MFGSRICSAQEEEALAPAMGGPAGGADRPAGLDRLMRHIPHLYVGGVWDDALSVLSQEQTHHLERVLRVGSGSAVTYTDGRGRIGNGEYRGGEVTRGEESTVGRPNTLTFAVAPPANRDRCRFLVEKLAEIGVARLQWLETRFGEGKVPSAEQGSGMGGGRP